MCFCRLKRLHSPVHRGLCWRHSCSSILVLCFPNSYFGKGSISLQAFKCTLEIRVSLRVLFNKSYSEGEVNPVRTLPSCAALIKFDDLHFLIMPPVSEAAHDCTSPHPSQRPPQSGSDAPKGLHTGASELCPPARSAWTRGGSDAIHHPPNGSHVWSAAQTHRCPEHTAVARLTDTRQQLPASRLAWE